MKLTVRPIGVNAANDYVRKNHRHHGVTAGGRFAIACYEGDVLHGVAICCRPVARALDDGLTLEVARFCTDGRKNACSCLYSACARIAREMGYKKIITYILETEAGTSLKGSNWEYEADTRGHSWSTPSRERVDKAPTCNKQRWGKRL